MPKGLFKGLCKIAHTEQQQVYFRNEIMPMRREFYANNSYTGEDIGKLSLQKGHKIAPKEKKIDDFLCIHVGRHLRGFSRTYSIDRKG